MSRVKLMKAHEGWKQIRNRYDDGGFSGGSMDGPALRKLLSDVEAERIDVIVVYASTHLLGAADDRVGWTEGVAEEVGRKTS
jgi:site-specific DNA recombinase